MNFNENLQRHRFHEKNDFFRIFVNYYHDLCVFDDEDDQKLTRKLVGFVMALNSRKFIYVAMFFCKF